MSTGSQAVEDLLAAWERGRQELRRPPVGSKENPFVLVVPEWAHVDEERGQDLQAVADEIFLPAVRVEVCRGLP